MSKIPEDYVKMGICRFCGKPSGEIIMNMKLEAVPEGAERQGCCKE
jgi:hypothetical protein